MNEESAVTPRALVLIAVLFHLNGCLFERSKTTPTQAPAPAAHWIRQGQTLELTPPEAHHFNVKAPQELNQAGKPIELTMASEKITVRLDHVNLSERIQGTLMICDTQETYCRPLKIEIDPKEIPSKN